MNTPRLFARPQIEARGWNSELALRYGAATLVTLIALAAAQLVLPTQWMLTLGAITLLGVPVSLWMRLNQMRIGGLTVPRPLWNAVTVVASLGASAWQLSVQLRNIMAAVEGGMNEAAVLRLGATEPMLLLVQLFLVFAAFRSFSLISDKDATLATVPSFSVLLLLIPVYPNIEVVCYFLLWTLVATMLFALDHRSEIRERVTATVPAPAPGQDVKLAARSLAGVLSISLVAAITLSGLLTARDPRDGSSSDSAISLLAMRLTRLNLQAEDASGASGPQRQIDFSSGTALPSRAELWSVTANTRDGTSIFPTYWRLFTLGNYDGSTWSQNNDNVRAVGLTPLTRELAPRLRRLNSDGRLLDPQRSFGDPTRPPRIDGGRGTSAERNIIRERASGGENAMGGERAGGERARGGGRRGDAPFGRNREPLPFSPEQNWGDGFVIAKAQPRLKDSFGRPRQRVYFRLQALRTSLGFVPLLPATTTLQLPSGEQDNLRVRADGGVDANIIPRGQIFRGLSQVPAVAEYGLPIEGPPLTVGDNEPSAAAPSAAASSADAPSADAPTLSAADRARYLELPAIVPARVREFARTTTLAASEDSSNYARARLLARATREGAIYTLRPPAIPDGRDAADFFLFESRRGYCTYFAGALTVLCRAQNIPARVVSGFIAPDEAAQETVVIRDANAHAWTEVWVENWGWAAVDATPPGDRGDNAPTLLENWSDLLGANLDQAFRWSLTHWPLLVGVTSTLLFAFAVWRFRRGIARRLGRVVAEDAQAQRRQIAADYARVARGLARRFRPRAAWETPDEWLHAARAQVPGLPLEPLQTLTSLYVRARFSPHELGADAAQSARQARERVVWPRRRTK